MNQLENRAPHVAWFLRRNDYSTYVRTAPDDLIQIAVGGSVVELGRRDARLLAKRINQCLDETTGAALAKLGRMQ